MRSLHWDCVTDLRRLLGLENDPHKFGLHEGVLRVSLAWIGLLSKLDPHRPDSPRPTNSLTDWSLGTPTTGLLLPLHTLTVSTVSPSGLPDILVLKLTTENLHFSHPHRCRPKPPPRGIRNCSHPRIVPVPAMSSQLKEKLFSSSFCTPIISDRFFKMMKMVTKRKKKLVAGYHGLIFFSRVHFV